MVNIEKIIKDRIKELDEEMMKHIDDVDERYFHWVLGKKQELQRLLEVINNEM